MTKKQKTYFLGVVLTLLMVLFAVLNTKLGKGPIASASDVGPTEDADPTKSFAPAQTPALTPAPPEVLAQPKLVGDSAEFGLTVTPIDGSNDQWIDLSFKGFKVISNETGVAIQMDGQGLQLAGGAPDIPTLVHGFAGRPGESARVEITEVTFKDHEGYEVAPRVDRAKATGPRTEDPDIYGVDAFWPPQLVEVDEAYQGRRKFVRIEYRPFQYNPDSGVLRQYENIRARLSYGPEETFQAAALSGVTGFDDNETVANPGDCGCSNRLLTPETLLPPMRGQPGDFARRRAGAEVDACIRIKVTEAGIHRLTFGNLKAAGIPAADLVGNQLRMFYKDRELAIRVSRTGPFVNDTTDHITFYAEPFTSYTTDDNYYWLGFGPGGLRMVNRSVSDDPSLGAPIDQACRQIIPPERTIYADSIVDSFRGLRMEVDDGGFAGWWMANVSNSSGPGDQDPVPFTLRGTDHAVAGSDVSVQGLVYAYSSGFPLQCGLFNNGASCEHNLYIRKPSFEAVLWHHIDGHIREEMLRTFPASQLDADGTTSYLLTGNVGAVDRMLIPSLTFEFERHLYADNDRLNFGGTAGDMRYELRDFVGGGGQMTLLDVTDGYEPVRLFGFSTFASAAGRGIRFTDRLTYNPCYSISGRDGYLVVPASNIETVNVRNLADPSRQVDYLVIATAGYEDEVHRLLDHRDFKGLEVLVATDQDVYNEFSYGVHDPVGIKQCIGYAFHHWARGPKYVLLVGDTTHDPKFFDPLSTASPVLPSPFGPTSFLFTALDMTYAMVNGDDKLVDVAIGRLPVNNLAQLKAVVDKIIQYEGQITTEPLSGWRSRITLIADKPKDGDNFGADTSHINTDIVTSSPYSATVLQHNGNPASMKTLIRNEINAGTFMVNYMGHGALTQWASDNIFASSDVNLLINNRYPIVTVFTCQNGVYQFPRFLCSSETFLLRPNRGAIAVIAPSALAIHQVSEQLNREMYNAMLNNLYVDGIIGANLTRHVENTERLGEAINNGMLAIYLGVGQQSFELQFYNLFGDPALLVSPE